MPEMDDKGTLVFGLAWLVYTLYVGSDSVTSYLGRG